MKVGRRGFLKGLLGLAAAPAAVAAAPEPALRLMTATEAMTYLDQAGRVDRYRATHQTYALGFRISNEMLDDNQLQLIESMGAEITRHQKHWESELARELLEDML